MSGVRYLQSKLGRYNFRRRYPRRLVLLIGPGEIVRALPPCTYLDAVGLVRRFTVISDKVFQMALKVSDLTRDDFEDLAREQFNKFLQKYEDDQASPDPDDPERWISASQKVLSEQEWEKALLPAKKVLSYQGYELDVDDPALREFCRMLIRALAESSRIATSRLGGDYTARPEDPLFQGADKHAQSPSKIRSIRVSEAHEKIMTEKDAKKAWRTETHREFKNMVDLATEWFGDRMLSEISRQEVSTFREMLQCLPKFRGKTPELSNKSIKELIAITKSDSSVERIADSTVGKHMRNLVSLFKWAMQNGYVSDNQASGVYQAPKRKRKTSDERTAWSIKQLLRWFNCPVYSGCESLKRRYSDGKLIIKDHHYWFPLIALYHPIRAEEIAQLMADDIVAENGIWLIDISGGLYIDEIDETGKQIKNLTAKRRIPIHRILIEMGFMNYVKETQKAKHVRLFYHLKPSGKGKRFSAYYCKRFSYYKKLLGIKDASFHSFRHNAITSLSENHPNTDINDELAGHTIYGQRGRYRKGASIEALKTAIDLISFQRIDEMFLK